MWIVIAFLFVLASPFLGFGAAAWAFGVALARPSVIAAGHLVADFCGYGALVRTSARYIAWKRGVRTPTGGGIGQDRAVLSPFALRGPALSILELSLPTPPPPGFTPGRTCTGHPSQELAAAAVTVSTWFNAGFGAGYAAGTAVVVVLTILGAPFSGAGAAWYQFGAALWRAVTAQASGRLVTDALGLSELVEQSTAAMTEEMAQAQAQQQRLVVPQPFYGGAPPQPPPGSLPPHAAAAFYPSVPPPGYYASPHYQPPLAAYVQVGGGAVAVTAGADPQPIGVSASVHAPLLDGGSGQAEKLALGAQWRPAPSGYAASAPPTGQGMS